MYGFSPIYHESLMKNLIKTIHSGKHGHAYIFEGEKGLGKLTSAKLFATALTCVSSSISPCGQCSACIQGKSDSNPDIIFVNSGDKKSIGTDKIREVSADAYIKPFNSSCKVYIIEQGDLMTEQAQNSLLKVLEEPPSYVVFLIISTDSSTLLQTVLSRCILVRFPSLSNSYMEEYVKTHYPSEIGRCNFLVKYSGGNPETIARLINDEAFEPLRQNSFTTLDLFFDNLYLSAYTIADILEKNKDNVLLFFDFWQEILRDILLIQCDNRSAVTNQDYISYLEKKAQKIDEKHIILALEQILLAKQMLARYVNLRAISLNLALNIKKGIH